MVQQPWNASAATMLMLVTTIPGGDTITMKNAIKAQLVLVADYVETYIDKAEAEEVNELLKNMETNNFEGKRADIMEKVAKIMPKWAKNEATKLIEKFE